jgi:hypothetical protein
MTSLKMVVVLLASKSTFPIIQSLPPIKPRAALAAGAA